MAADLTADLDEAEAEGGSPEDVLGNSAFDPRQFAAAWAASRGVTAPPPPPPPPAPTAPTAPERRRLWRPPVAIAFSALVGILIVAAGFVLLVGHRSASIAFATRRVVPGPGSIRLFAGPGHGPVHVQIAGGFFGALAVLFLIGVVVAAGLFAALHWAPWFASRRYRRPER
jgi:hypothetical protein